MHEAATGGFQTPAILFLGIIAVYVCLSLAIGGKKVYFEPYSDKEEDKTSKSA